MSAKTVRVSQSQINEFRECEEKYFLSHVRHLQRIDKAPAPALGVALHDYLENFYRYVKVHGPKSRREAHMTAAQGVLDRHTPELEQMAKVCRMLGNAESAARFEGMADAMALMMNRYYAVRGKQDAEEHEILIVELPVTVRLAAGLNSVGVIDLVTRSRSSGKVLLWEHKSTTSVPSQAYRMRDLQTTLYAAKLRTVLDLEVDGVVWNYIRTKPPAQPEPLKSGGLSRAKGIDTSWYLYEQAIKEHGLDVADYEDMKAALQYREETVFYPRYQMYLVAEEEIVLRDYVQTAKAIKSARTAWEKERRAPVRTLTRACDWCAYVSLCQAEIMGGDIESAIEGRFEVVPDDRRGPKRGSEEE